MIFLIGIAIVLDLLIGDPPNWPHPIRFFGWIITKIESVIRSKMSNLYLGGFVLLFSSILCVLISLFLIKVIIHPFFYKILEIYLLTSFLATKCLSIEALKVKKYLKEGDLPSARTQLSHLVGRDTSELSLNEVTRGVIETVAENTIDGVLAPLFYMLIGIPFGLSVPFALIYKMVNTLDSMVGYIHSPYKEIGYASAKFDDLLNFIPARVCSIIMILSGAFFRFDVKRGFEIYFRDRLNHKSPNSGHPESAVAGVLGIQIGGTNSYFGNVVEKPTIGDAVHSLREDHISNTIQIMRASELTLYSICLITYFMFN